MSAYLGVSACAMFTNLFALAIMFNATDLRRPRNYFIVGHMLSDAFQCAFVMPISLLMTFHFYWYLDELSCKAASFLKAASFYSSYMTLAALGAHQFISYNCKININWFLLIFVLSGVFALPYVLAVAIEVVDFYEPWDNKALDRTLASCNMTRPRICAETHWSLLPIDQTTYLLTTLALMYILPIAGLTLSYLASARVRFDKPLPQFCGSTARKNREDLCVFTLLISLYLLGWLPMTVFTSLHLQGQLEFTYNRYLICQTIGVSSSVVKPICYGLTNRAIREMYVDSLRCLLFPCGLCARPQRTQLRRLLRLAVARRGDLSSASSSVFDSDDDDEPCQEVFVDTSSYLRYRTYRLPTHFGRCGLRPESTASFALADSRQQSFVDRRVVHPDYQRRLAYHSVR